jgi:squalene/oxidosqualene cyclase-like protein
MLQCDDGHWAGDYGGPMFLMPGLIIVLHITKADFPEYKKDCMKLYLRNHQQEDGGWGTHIECASTLFGTVLSYVSLRLLGESAEEDHMVHARQFMSLHGGALYAPSWAKFWLAVLGVYDWRGINSIPTEMWFLPHWLPFHPWKLWCHCRMVYLPMGYLYCIRATAPNILDDEVVMALRKELYPGSCNYDNINWNDYRQTCADIDNYSPLNPLLKISQDMLVYYEYCVENISWLSNLRKRSNEYVMRYINAEDIQTNFIDIGPVNKSLNMLSVYYDSKCNMADERVQKHLMRIDDYLWVAEDGMKMQGYNGSQCWDTSFAVQAITEGGFTEAFPECTSKIYSYLKRTQISSDEVDREKYFRHVSKGGWPFSTAGHGWPISDCTAEGLKGVLKIHSRDKSCTLIPASERISDRRLQDAVNVILELHNEDGGWATYENNRGAKWFELLNPSEVFGDIMIDYSYVECTSACITALVAFKKAQPNHRSSEVVGAIEAGRSFIHSIQRPDGSWYGSWGVCFIYGTWFGVEGLVAAGEPTDSPSIRRAVQFLLSRQNPNGGWGESYVACVDKAYPPDGAGEVIIITSMHHIIYLLNKYP